MNIYQVSVPVFLRGLEILSELLHKGEVHCKATGSDPDALVSHRLAPDMLTLAGQVQRASDTANAGDTAQSAPLTRPRSASAIIWSTMPAIASRF